MDYDKIAEKALEERARIVGERREVNDDKTLSEAEKRERFEAMDADIDRLMGEAREAVEAGEREAEVRDLTERSGKLGAMGTPGERREDDGNEFADGLRGVALGDLRSFDFDFDAAVVESKAYRDTLVSDGAGYNKGGEAGPVTPNTFVAQLLESLEESSAIVSQVRKITTSSGEPMDWPRRESKTGNTFQRIEESGAYPAASDGSFSLQTLGAIKFGAIAEVSEEAVSDPALNVFSIVAQDMGEDLADSLANALWNGGLTESILATALNTVETATAGAITFDELIDLQHAIIQRYRRNAQFYLNDTTARSIRKVKNNDGDYIWQPSVIAGQPDLLLGKPVETDPFLPGLAAGERGVVFGNVNRYYTLRTVRNLSVTRSDEYGFDRDMIALKIRWRGDGMVTDPEAIAVAFGNDGVA